MGAIPPLNQEDWEIAFEKYKQIPQFEKINSHFTLYDFKFIFFWEYFHRLIGRLIGIVFVIPFLWFYFKKMLDRKTTQKVLLLFLLGGLQGFLGWFMVKSGLSDRTSVSHIRLAIHLITAFITFGFTLYFALELMDKRDPGKYYKRANALVKSIFAFVIIQVIYGAFVAGMHAGKIYNTFPLMNGRIMPEEVLIMQPAWINIFENQATVQFIHRMLAYVIVVLAIVLFYEIQKEKITGLKRKGVLFLLFSILVQFLLGVFTLLSGVDFTLAILHQATAFFVFSSCTYLVFVYRKSKSFSNHL